MNQAHPDHIDWRAVIVNALALAYVLFCMFVMVWFVAPLFWPEP